MNLPRLAVSFVLYFFYLFIYFSLMFEKESLCVAKTDIKPW